MGEQAATAENAKDITLQEVRCPKCNYFVCQPLSCEGKTVLKVNCRSCREHLAVSVTPKTVTVGLI
jgi:hypothetical protein